MEFDACLYPGINDDTKEKQLNDSGLSREEIERLSVDEDLKDLQRAKLFLTPNAHQAAAGRAFSTIMQDESTPKEIAVWMLPTVLAMIEHHRNSDVLQSWLEVLCSMAVKLPLQVVREDLLQFALARGKVDEAAQARVVCGHLLGAIIPLLEKDAEYGLLSKAMALCQDTDVEVRICMCKQLNSISRAFGIEATKKFVLPELYELLKDEQISVQHASLSALVGMLDFLPSDIKQLKIIPIIRLLFNQNDAQSLSILAKLFGEIMSKVTSDVPEEDIQALIDCYKSVVCHPSEEVRQFCASSFLQVLKCLGGRKYAAILHTTYLQLIQDPSSQVRFCIAAEFHEVSKILGKERTTTYLKEAFFTLLKDNAREVQAAFIGVMRDLIGQFSITNEQQRSAIYTSMIPSLLHLEKEVSCTRKWRLQVSLLETFSHLHEHITSDQIHEHFVPVCFRHMIDSILPVRSAAAMTLAVFIRQNQRAKQRYDLAQRVVKEFGHGRDYWLRTTYIDFCHSFLRISSTQMFKENFLDAAVLMLQDEVVGVRMHACTLLPLLKAAIKLPEDVAALERINFCATQRLNDNDKNVVAAARSVADAFKQINVRCSAAETGSETFPIESDFERLDTQREDEEWNMLSKEEQDEKRKVDEMLQRCRLDGGKKSALPFAVGGNLSINEGPDGARKALSRQSIIPRGGSIANKMKSHTPPGLVTPLPPSTLRAAPSLLSPSHTRLDPNETSFTFMPTVFSLRTQAKGRGSNTTKKE